MITNEMVKMIYEALDNKKAMDIKVVDIRNVSVMADYFIVASGDNQNQLMAMQNEVDKTMHENGVKLRQIEGNRNSTWILMDYEDVIVHIFSEEDRLFYNLEKIWQDGIDVDIDVLFRILGFEEEEFGYDHARHALIDLLIDEDDPVAEQSGIDVVTPLTGAGLLNDIRYQTHLWTLLSCE
jgi:ribosome-associated protein